MSRRSRALTFVSFSMLAALWSPAAAQTPVPFDIQLIATGAGSIGTNWISLPNATPIKTAEQLCAAIGPTATSVAQFFPDVNRRYTWSCAGGPGACTTTNPAATIPEPGCTASACFCIDDGEGYDVRVSADTTFRVDGCESPVAIGLPAGSAAGGGRQYLASVPYDTTLVTWNDLALAAGLPSTGLTRGTVTGINPVNGIPTSCMAGSAACMSVSLVRGRAYRLGYTVDAPGPYANPTASPGPCVDFDTTLVATGAGAIGTNWISLPTSTPIKTAEDLCRVIGPNATSVAQFFPDLNRRYTWTCAGGAGACTTTNPAGTIPEPGCSASSCFCIDDGEGLEIKVGANTPFHIAGCESTVPIALPAGSPPAEGLNWLASVPFVTGLATWNDLAIATGLPSTGVQRGSVTGIDPVTGVPSTCLAGSAGCMATPLVTGRAYRLRYLTATPPPYTNPAARAAPCFTCGNTVLEAAFNEEMCDDGNTAAGDCCSPTCSFDPVGTACIPDADGCTSDLCNGAGVCVYLGPANSTCGDGLVCALTEFCDPPGLQGPCNCGFRCNAACGGCLLAGPVAGAADALTITGFDAATGAISITYGPACQATDYTVYWGNVVRPWDGTYTGQSCNLGCSGSATFNPGPGDIFFYVVGNDGVNEGSYGVDSLGNEIPEAVGLPDCDYPQTLANTCP